TTSSTASSSASASGNDSPNDAEVDCNSEVQPRCGQVASRRTRESSRDQRPTPAGARLTGRLGFHSRRPSKPPSRNVEHDRGEPPGSAPLAARRARYPRPEQMARKMLRNVEIRGVHAAGNGPSSDRKYWQRLERNGSPSPCVAKPEITRSGMGHPLSGARETWLAPTSNHHVALATCHPIYPTPS